MDKKTKTDNTNKKVQELGKLGIKLGLKELQVGDIRLVFQERVVMPKPPKLTKEQKEVVEKIEENIRLDELQIEDPVAYEEALIATNGIVRGDN